MSDFEFVLVHGSDFNLETNVFEFVIGGGRGATGSFPNIADLPEKTTINGADIGILEDSEDDNAQKKWSFNSLKTWLTTAFNLLYAAIFNRLPHGVFDATETFNATTASEHTGTLVTPTLADVAGLTAARPSLLLQFDVTTGGAPTMILFGAPIYTFATSQNLTSLADGIYQVVFSSVDDNVNVIVYVKKVA